ncbi:MAG: M23 family metallopeptidase [Actinobacteria bacterium]|nr:M23 family metallopeptidase [Actinomycetota bacterium]
MKHTPSRATIGTALSAVALGGLIVGSTAGVAAADNTAAPSSAELAAVVTEISGQTASTETANGMEIPMKAFEVSAPYGDNTGAHAGRGHDGVDLAGPMGAKIYSATPGKVIHAGDGGGYGNLVKVRTDDGHVILYGHLSKILVKKGDKVAAGDLIGKEGSTGHSTGPHLHFEVRNAKDKPIDPVKYLGLTQKELAEVGR